MNIQSKWIVKRFCPQNLSYVIIVFEAFLNNQYCQGPVSPAHKKENTTTSKNFFAPDQVKAKVNQYIPCLSHVSPMNSHIKILPNVHLHDYINSCQPSTNSFIGAASHYIVQIAQLGLYSSHFTCSWVMQPPTCLT